MPGWCAARRDLAGDQKGPFHKHAEGTAQHRSRVGGVTLLLLLSGSDRQTGGDEESLTAGVVGKNTPLMPPSSFLLNSCGTKCQTLLPIAKKNLFVICA